MKDRIFLDTNILVYAFVTDTEITKAVLSQKLLNNNPLISPQVVFEFINVTRRKLKYTFEEYKLVLESVFSVCEVVNEDFSVVEKALDMLSKYSLQPFDAKIVATALHHNCDILYSEDMQNGLIIENKLKIVNPSSDK